MNDGNRLTLVIFFGNWETGDGTPHQDVSLDAFKSTGENTIRPAAFRERAGDGDRGLRVGVVTQQPANSHKSLVVLCDSGQEFCASSRRCTSRSRNENGVR